MNIKKHLILIFSLCFVLMSSSIVLANDTATITAASIAANAEDEIEIPITLENNPGIIALQLYIEYDEGLTLKSVTRGNALGSLNYTPSGTMDTFPFKILFDGLQNDSSNGTLVTLKFDIAENCNKNLNVSVYSNPGEVYNYALNDIDINFNSGTVTVNGGNSEPSNSISNTHFTQSGKEVNVTATVIKNADDAKVIAVAYNSESRLIGVKSILASEIEGCDFSQTFSVNGNADVVSVMMWDFATLKPLCRKDVN